MYYRKLWSMVIAGVLAGTVNGLFGAGGGMILVPLLTLTPGLNEETVFPASVSIILPICLISLTAMAIAGTLCLQAAIPYMLGSILGGIAAGKWGNRIPVLWLHRFLGAMILWGGIRYLC